MRRPLDFDSFDALEAEVDRLRREGYTRGGNWSLAQILDHLALYMRMSLEGFPFRFRWYMRLPARLLFLRITLNRRWIPEGFRGPRVLEPPASAAANDRPAVEAFRQTLHRVRDHRGEFRPSPLFGQLSPEQWRQLHLIHAAHHLSFLLPRTGQPGSCEPPRLRV